MTKLIQTRTNLVECVGSMATDGKLQGTIAADDAHEAVTYANVHNDVTGRARGYMQKYEEFIINYAVEWERVLTERVQEDIRRTDNHKRDFDHYAKKVDSLRSAHDKLLMKGKVAKGEDIDRLQRNEIKLRTAETDYHKCSEDLLMLIDEVVNRGWKDLLPLIIKMAQFDATYAADEAQTFHTFHDLTVKMKQIGDLFQVDNKPRLRALRLEKPEDISTARIDANVSSDALTMAPLAIKDQPAPNSPVPQSVSVTRSRSPDYSVPDDEKTANVSPITVQSNYVGVQTPEAKESAPPMFPSIPEEKPHVQEFKAKSMYASGRNHDVVLSSNASASGDGIEMENVSVSEEYSLAGRTTATDGSQSYYSAVNKATQKAEDINSKEDASEMGAFVQGRANTNPFM